MEYEYDLGDVVNKNENEDIAGKYKRLLEENVFAKKEQKYAIIDSFVGDLIGSRLYNELFSFMYPDVIYESYHKFKRANNNMDFAIILSKYDIMYFANKEKMMHTSKVDLALMFKVCENEEEQKLLKTVDFEQKMNILHARSSEVTKLMKGRNDGV